MESDFHGAISEISEAAAESRDFWGRAEFLAQRVGRNAAIAADCGSKMVKGASKNVQMVVSYARQFCQSSRSSAAEARAIAIANLESGEDAIGGLSALERWRATIIRERAIIAVSNIGKERYEGKTPHERWKHLWMDSNDRKELAELRGILRVVESRNAVGFVPMGTRVKIVSRPILGFLRGDGLLEEIRADLDTVRDVGFDLVDRMNPSPSGFGPIADDLASTLQGLIEAMEDEAVLKKFLEVMEGTARESEMLIPGLDWEIGQIRSRLGRTGGNWDE